MRRVAAIFFILLIFVSGSNITLGTHFCGGYAVDSQVMLGHQHLDCGMKGMDSKMAMNESSHEAMLFAGCCDNEYQTLLTDDNFHQVKLKIQHDWSFIPVPKISLAALELQDNTTSSFEEYSPPLIERDFTVLHQSFLI